MEELSAAERELAAVLAAGQRGCGLSQAEVARRAHVAPSRLSEALRGRYLPSWHAARSIGAVLGLAEDLLRSRWEAAQAARRWRTRAFPVPLVTGWEGAPVLEEDVLAVMRAQIRAGEQLPQQLFGPRRLPLSGVHVAQRLNERRLSREHGAGRTWTGGAGVTLEEGLARHRHVLLVGGPGQGKSTLTLQLASRLAQVWIARNGLGSHQDSVPRGLGPMLPLRVTARHLVSFSDCSWAESIGRAAVLGLGQHLDQMDSTTMAHRVASLVGGIPWLLLVDGLDEVPNVRDRDRLLGVLAERIGESESPHRLLVTTRPLSPGDDVGFGPDSRCGRYELEPFNIVELERFAHRWFDGDERIDADGFLSAVRRVGLRSVVSIPLLAAIAAVAFERYPGNSLPRYRHDLYEYFIAHQAANFGNGPGWQEYRARIIEAVGLDVADMLLGVESRERLIERLAEAEVEGSGTLAGAAEAWVWAEDAPARRLPPEWNYILGSVLTRTGLVTQRGGSLTFVHLSFAEHLSGAYRARLLPADFDPASAAWRSALEDARSRRTGLRAVATLIHYGRDNRVGAHALLDFLLAGETEHQSLAVQLLSRGMEGEERHYQWACQILEYGISHANDRHGDWVHWLGDLAASRSEARAALERLAANRLVASWLRAGAVVQLAVHPGQTPNTAAERLRALVDEPRSDSWAQGACGAALADLGPGFRDEGISILKNTLADPYSHPNARANAANALSRYDPELRHEAIEQLRRLLADPFRPYWEIMFIARGLAEFGPEFHEEAAVELRKVISAPLATVKEKSNTVACYVTLDAVYQREAVTALNVMIHDTELTTQDRIYACGRLSELGHDYHAEVVEFLYGALVDGKLDVAARIQVAETLNGLGGEYRSKAKEILCEIIDNPAGDDWGRQDAAQMLARIDSGSYTYAVDFFRSRANDSDASWLGRQRAAGEMARLGPELHEESIGILRSVMHHRDADWESRVEAADWVSRISSGYDMEVAECLRAALADSGIGTELRLRAARVLAWLDPTHPDAAADNLLKVIADSGTEASDKIKAAVELGRLGEAYRNQAFEALRSVLAHSGKNSLLCRAATHAMTNLSAAHVRGLATHN